MTSYKRGDVVLVPFPFTDLTTVKQRPALVVSSSRFNSAQEDAIVVAITSNITKRRGKHHEYRIKGVEQRASGLPKEGVALCGKIITIDQRLIRTKLGALPRGAVGRVVEGVNAIIGEQQAG